jgi:putative restriction endonuclease
MRAFVAVTDESWYEQLQANAPLDEVNFWQPGGNKTFGAIGPGELFLWKLHSPNNFIVGGGIFAHATVLPVSLAWEAFGTSNGVRSLSEMRSRIEYYRKSKSNPVDDYVVGCILLEQPFFLPQSNWIPVPDDWKRNIVQGKTYDLTVGVGLELRRRLEGELGSLNSDRPTMGADSDLRFAAPVLVRPRLGQGSFRVLVTDVYQRRCAISGERTLPVLEAAHIQPYALGGEHRIDNGLLLRSDLHTLFDRGYVTVTHTGNVEVSRRIREEFENGRDYYALHGRQLRMPMDLLSRPSIEALVWHNEHVFRG